MLAELLREEGWENVAFTGGGNVAGELGFARGFERYREDDGGLARTVPDFVRWLGEGMREPFFAFLHSYDVHLPYDPPRPYDRRFDRDYEGSIVGAATRDLCREIRGLDRRDEPGDSGDPTGRPELTERDRAHLVALYDGEIRHADARIGELIAHLQSRDLLDRTVVVAMSDHGEEFWDHGTVLHSHTVYQELVHVPLVFRIPGSPGRLVNETVRNLEIAPTILDLAGLAPAPSHQGMSLRELGGSGSPAPLSAVSEMRRWKSIVAYPWKLLVGGPTGGRSLHDLQSDPGETRNREPEHSELADDLQRLLDDLVSGEEVPELSEGLSPELEERLRALGYVD